jgi:hypothetical protein
MIAASDMSRSAIRGFGSTSDTDNEAIHISAWTISAMSGSVNRTALSRNRW